MARRKASRLKVVEMAREGSTYLAVAAWPFSWTFPRRPGTSLLFEVLEGLIRRLRALAPL